MKLKELLNVIDGITEVTINECNFSYKLDAIGFYEEIQDQEIENVYPSVNYEGKQEITIKIKQKEVKC